MKMLATVVAVLAAAFVATGAWASDGGVIEANGQPQSIVQTPARTGLMDAWNDTASPTWTYTYGASCFGFDYVPSQDYYLQRIEFIGGGNGMVTVELRDDDGGSCPTGPILQTVSYTEVGDRTWQGADFPGCVFVQQGHSYFVKFYVVVGGYCSFADSGTIYPHCWSWDCVGWDGPSGSFAWMVRFYGQYEPTASEQATWSSLKSLYR